ncbi:hypothetical protein VKT23_018711 [Stygiomarasmius scandens]|uniref:Uncharacterized protein n=1 Tax=Marasmiellus scandens TaxID=2682957 RepID=A0ABR1IQV3_9AGAR
MQSYYFYQRAFPTYVTPRFPESAYCYDQDAYYYAQRRVQYAQNDVYDQADFVRRSTMEQRLQYTRNDVHDQADFVRYPPHSTMEHSYQNLHSNIQSREYRFLSPSPPPTISYPSSRIQTTINPPVPPHYRSHTPAQDLEYILTRRAEDEEKQKQEDECRQRVIRNYRERLLREGRSIDDEDIHPVYKQTYIVDDRSPVNTPNLDHSSSSTASTASQKSPNERSSRWPPSPPPPESLPHPDEFFAPKRDPISRYHEDKPRWPPLAPSPEDLPPSFLDPTTYTRAPNTGSQTVYAPRPRSAMTVSALQAIVSWGMD